eukprot:1183510-Alexandrium_andersonii.AAC.1
MVGRWLGGVAGKVRACVVLVVLFHLECACLPGGVGARGRGDGNHDNLTTNFGLQALTATAHSALFARFMGLVMMLEDVTLALARWSEDCVCHGAFLPYARRARAEHPHRKRKVG